MLADLVLMGGCPCRSRNDSAKQQQLQAERQGQQKAGPPNPSRPLYFDGEAVSPTSLQPVKRTYPSGDFTQALQD